MQAFFQNLVIGIQTGAVYALIAVGYTMVYGVLRLINFAHADVYMVGAYVGLMASQAIGMETSRTPVGLAAVLVISMASCALLGVVIERFAYRPLRNAPRITALITAIGVSLLLEALALLIWGPTPRNFPRAGVTRPIPFLGLEISPKYLIILAVTTVLMAALWYVVTRTRVGKAMRAVSHDREAAALMGIDTNRIVVVTFALGSSLAGAAGFLVSAITNVKIDPYVGVFWGLKSFVAAVLGGIGSIPGAMLGGMVMGISETYVAASPGGSSWRDAIAFVLLILILIFRPAGILGRSTVEKV